MINLRKVLPIAFVSLVIPVGANAAVIDFESLSIGAHSSPLSFTNVGGSGVDVTITSGGTSGTMSVYDTGPTHNHALLDYDVAGNTGTVITFSTAVSGFSLEAADYNQDDDTPLTIKLYDSSDNLLDTVSVPWDASATIPDFALLSSSATGVSKVVFTNGGPYPGSIFLDNVTFGAVPEPATMLGLGAGSALLIRRRRSRKA
ncbi:MAG: hypothetical protein QOJ65_589 [Fimbriimonadaceae bacterium]|jgi:hypothetical protein|nr:hypothetical protein [Fimbriimonadaceae bacterium]